MEKGIVLPDYIKEELEEYKKEYYLLVGDGCFSDESFLVTIVSQALKEIKELNQRKKKLRIVDEKEEV